MTTVEMKRNAAGKIVAFTVDGHTGLEESGKDILCASVSSAVWMTMNGLEQLLGIPISYREGDGHIECSLPELSQDMREKADVLLESMDAFLEELTHSYGDFIVKREV